MTAQNRFFFHRSSYLIRGLIPELLPCCKMGLRIKSEGLKEGGFTLVELAIALMVIGLLIGGVLKGQELIENARVIRTVKDVKDYDTAIMIFRNTYNALPGDLKNAGALLPDCGPPYCNQTITALGDNIISNNQEMISMWIHLERAGLISGINEDADHYSVSPKNAFGGHFLIGHITRLGYGVTPTPEHPALHRFRIGDKAGGGVGSDTLQDCARVRRLDEKLDDGKPHSGKAQIYLDGAHCVDADTQTYTNTKRRAYILVEVDAAN